MLIEEATWWGNVIQNYESSTILPMLNFGSSSESFRKNDHYWIEKYIFEPLATKGQILHMDIIDDPGVQIRGDITKQEVLDKLQEIKFKSIFCSNLFEHVENREEIGKRLTSLIPSGGYIFVSCPYKYPYHPDPIDTLFRPDFQELSALFPNTEIVNKYRVITDRYYKTLLRNPKRLIRMLARLLFPFYRPKGWAVVLQYFFWTFRCFETTCVVLKRNDPGK